MKPSHDEPDINRQYLLGKLTGDEREQFEDRYFADDELFDDLEAAEDDLIDDYLTGDLSEEDTSLFRENYLVGAERQQRLRVGTAWRNHAVNKAKESPQKKIEPAPVWQWRQLLSPYPLRIAAFAAVILIAAVGVWRVFYYQSDVDKGLVALNAAYRDQRPLETRITGLSYAPFVTTRAGEPGRVDSFELDSAERILLDAVRDHPEATSYHALGKYYLAKNDFDKAIHYFEEALKTDPNNARVHADLGATLLEKGKLEIRNGKPDETPSGSGIGLESFARSLEHLNKALEINPVLLEALFNRALVYEYMFLPPQAVEAWKNYLEKDASSQWAQEARRRLARLEEQNPKALQKGESVLESFLTAYRNNDHDTAWRMVSLHRDLTGGPVANLLIDGHLDSAISGRQEQAQENLDALSYVGRLEHERAGDMYVADVVEFLKSLPSPKRALLIDARKLMEQGRDRLLKTEGDAASYYANAKKLLTQLGDTAEAVYVEYPLGHSQLIQSKSHVSLATFDRVITQSENRQYKWLRAQTLNARANAQMGLLNYSAALDASKQSLELSEQIGDVTGVIKTTEQLAQEYFYLGNYGQSLAHHQRSLELSDDSSLEPRQGWRNYFSVPRTLSAMGLHSAAIEYEKEALRRAENLNMPSMVCRSYAILGLMYGGQGNYQEAIKNLEISIDLAEKFSDDKARKESIAYSLLQFGLVHRQAGHFGKAFDSYDRAIQLYGELEDFEPFRYVAHKGKLLSCINMDGCVSTAEEIAICLELFKGFREKILQQSARDSFFDTEQDIYDLAIGYEFSRNNVKSAFNYSEEARGRSLWDLSNDQGEFTRANSQPDVRFISALEPKDLDQIKPAIPPQAQILQYAVLKDKLLIWLISGNDFEAEEEVISQSTLDEFVLRYLKVLSSPSEPNPEALLRHGKLLYEILIKPIEGSLKKDKLLCIVPDKTLSYLPFSALISTRSGSYLVNEYEIAYAPSSSLFIRSSELAGKKSRGNEKLFAVGNPRFDQEKFPLPDLPSAAKEVKSIKGYYYLPHVLTDSEATKRLVQEQLGQAEVVHLAVHSLVDEINPMRSKLLLAKSPGHGRDTDSVLQAHEIYGLDLPRTRLVVLSACESGAGRYYRGEGMMGLSRTFLAAKVPLVVSTLWRVESESTADLMNAFHKNRTLGGLSSSRALQKAQQEMATGADQRYRSPYYWAGFTLAGGYANF